MGSKQRESANFLHTMISRNGTAASERGLVGSDVCRKPEEVGAAIFSQLFLMSNLFSR